MGTADVTGDGTTPLTPEELSEISIRYPYLKLVTEAGKSRLEGILHFNREHEGRVVEDSFKVVIDIPEKYPDDLPSVREVGGRTVEIAEKQKARITSFLDLHAYPSSGNACLGAPDELRSKFPKGASLHVFIDELVVPYFFGLSHFEREGTWPWGERSHGVLGLLESYGDRRIPSDKSEIVVFIQRLRPYPNWKEVAMYLRKVKKKRECLCGSGKVFADCHAGAWAGLINLQRDVMSQKVDIYQC